MTTIIFGKQPTKPAPTTGGPYVWTGSQWLPVATDTGDGVPTRLVLDRTTPDKLAVPTVRTPKAVALKNLPGIELVAIGDWPARTGRINITPADLRQALAARECPAVGAPVLKLGHDEPMPDEQHMRWDGEPAVGWVANLRLSENRAKLVGDYTGVPAWLADVMASAYPRRSVEIHKNHRCQIGHVHPFAITAVSLLGVQAPASAVIKSLHDVQALYTQAAAGDATPELIHEIDAALSEPATTSLAVRIGDRVCIGSVHRLRFDPGQKRDFHGRWTDGSPGHPNFKGLTDEAFNARADLVGDIIGKLMKTHSTHKTHTNEVGAWDPERDKLHREIADKLWHDNDHVPSDGRAVIAGGLGGAGKTTVLTEHAGVDTRQYMTINPDDIKEELAARGMIPAVPGHPDLSPMERAALVHEESSRIAHMLADRAYREKRNVIWDITMSSGSSVESRIKALQEAGYGEINGIFVNIPVDTSVERAMARYRRGVDSYLTGKGFGGRYVPPAIIRAQRTSSGGTINLDVFEKMRPHFTNSSVYDNSVTGQPPRKIN